MRHLNRTEAARAALLEAVENLERARVAHRVAFLLEPHAAPPAEEGGAAGGKALTPAAPSGEAEHSTPSAGEDVGSQSTAVTSPADIRSTATTTSRGTRARPVSHRE